MRRTRILTGAMGLTALVAVSAGVAISSARAQAPPAPQLVSATILVNNYRQTERSTVQFTFNEPVALNGPASSYLRGFALGTLGIHPVAASIEPNGFIVEADYGPKVNVGMFEQASVRAGAVVSTQAHAANDPAAARLTVTSEPTTSAPDLRGADAFNVGPAEGGAALPSRADQMEFFFDKPVERIVPSDFGYYPPGSTTPVMGTSIPAGGFTPGATSVTIAFPGTPGAGASGAFTLRGAAVGRNGMPSPVRLSNGDASGNVPGLPGLLSASDEFVASVVRVSTTRYDFTLNEAPTKVTPSDFFLYSARDGQFQGSAATVSGRTVEVTFPGVTRSTDIVLGSVIPGAATVNGVANSVGSEAVNPPAGYAAGPHLNRGIGFTPTGPSVTSSPASLKDSSCGSGDSPETNLQGQVPPVVRAAGFKGFNCNLTELGQYPAAGTTWSGGTWVGQWAGACAYLSTAGNGVMVINASDPRNPALTQTLSTPAFLNTWETLVYNPRRHLLAAASYENSWLAIYDVSDCAHPVLDASIDIGPIAKGHAGNWTPDGKTYYATQDYRGVGGRLVAIDTADPHQPKVITELSFPDGANGRPHDLSFNNSGTIAYMNQPGQFGNQQFSGPNGLVILDVSQIQHRVPHPRVTQVSTLFWNNGGQGQQTLPVTYNGQDYVITTDESGSGGVGGRAGACARGLSPFGFAQIINVNNPRRPYIVSKLRLQVDDPTKCAIADDAPNTGSFGYDSHYCNVNRLNDPTMLGCGYFESGMRLFRVTNPARPAEIGYFNPPPGHATSSEHALFSPVAESQTDWASSPPVFVGCTVWDQFQDNGYIMMKITHGPGKRLCKADSATADASLQ